MPRKLTRQAASDLYAVLSTDVPAPDTELRYKDPYTLLVAVTLSAQATDVGVNRATGPLFDVADTPEKIVALGEKKLGDYIKTIGLWRNKAKNVIALSQILLDKYDGEVPTERDLLEELPGVGRKTANVVCNVAFGQPTIAVDTHIFRVSNRTGLAPGKTPLEVEKGLERTTPDAYRRHAHNWLILHGRYVCKARTPECPRCNVIDICLYKEKTVEDESGKLIIEKRSRSASGKGSTRKTNSKKTGSKKVTKKVTKRKTTSKRTVRKRGTKTEVRQSKGKRSEVNEGRANA